MSETKTETKAAKEEAISYAGAEWTPQSTEGWGDGDPTAEPGTPEHLGSDRPYEGAPWPAEPKGRKASGK